MSCPRVSRSALVTVAGVVLGTGVTASGSAALLPPAGAPAAEPSVAAVVAPRTVPATVDQHRIPTASGEATSGSVRGATVVSVSRAWPVSGYAAVGVTWARGDELAATTLHVRTYDGDAWSSWHDLEAEDHDMPDAGTAEAAATQPGTAPLLIGEVDRVQVRVAARPGEAPRGLSLSVIDPGTSPADAGLRAPALTAPLTDAKALGDVSRPEIFSRAQWGADEDLRSGTPNFGSVQTTFVHHTVNANDYSADDVPAIMRSIYAYHTQSRGWSDIGYNVLVDRFGRLWEGRYGGLRRNVIGAHTLNYNEEAFGVSAIGNFEEVRPSSRMKDALGRVLAWKLDKAGLPATGSVTVQGVGFEMINGHRDAASTACPGGYLYAALPDIRIRAAAVIAAGDDSEPEPEPVVRDLRRTLNADTRPDVVVREDGGLRTLLGDAGPGFLTPTGVGSTAARLDTVTGIGDWNGDGTGDVLVRYRKSGEFEIRGIDDNGGMSTVLKEGNGRFASETSLTGSADLTGDGLRDLIIITATGVVKVVPRQDDGFDKAHAISQEWTASRAVLGAGDMNGDGIGDLLRIDTDGALWSLPGRGYLRYGVGVRLGGGWDERTNVVAGADLTGDRRPDLMGTDVSDGRTWIRPGGADGFGLPIGGWSGWSGARRTTVVTDATGDRFPDAVVVDEGGIMSVRPSRHGMWLRPSNVVAEGDWSAYRWLRLVGDWNGDGKVDLGGVEGDQLWIFHGRGDGTFGERTGGWTGWAERGNLAAPDDWNGDGLPDLMSRSRDGSVWLYRGRGANGVGEPVLMRPEVQQADVVTPVGRWDGDEIPDLLAILPGGAVELWPGIHKDPVPLASDTGLRRYNRVMGAGDLNDDGRPDLLATTRRGGTAYILPGSPTGLGTPIRVAGGWRAFTMIG